MRTLDSKVPVQQRIRVNVPTGRAGLAAFHAFCQRVLAKLRANIATNKDGEWIPLQWGPQAGQPALQGTESQWELLPISDTKARIHPQPQFLTRWRGHALDMTIRPTRARYLHFFSGGTEVFAKSVKLPRRDPRPDGDQIRLLGRM